MPIMINRLDNETTSKGLLKVGQVNCHNKSELIDELFKIEFDLLLVLLKEGLCHQSPIPVIQPKCTLTSYPSDLI